MTRSNSRRSSMLHNALWGYTAQRAHWGGSSWPCPQSYRTLEGSWGRPPCLLQWSSVKGTETTLDFSFDSQLVMRLSWSVFIIICIAATGYEWYSAEHTRYALYALSCQHVFNKNLFKMIVFLRLKQRKKTWHSFTWTYVCTWVVFTVKLKVMWTIKSFRWQNWLRSKPSRSPFHRESPRWLCHPPS